MAAAVAAAAQYRTPRASTVSLSSHLTAFFSSGGGGGGGAVNFRSRGDRRSRAGRSGDGDVTWGTAGGPTISRPGRDWTGQTGDVSRLEMDFVNTTTPAGLKEKSAAGRLNESYDKYNILGPKQRPQPR